MTDELIKQAYADIMRNNDGCPDCVKKGYGVLRALVSRSRSEALEEAARAVEAEHLEDPQEETGAAYDRAIDDASAAVRKLLAASSRVGAPTVG